MLIFVILYRDVKFMDVTPISEWLGSAERPIIISGPCSAESEQQVMETCLELASSGHVNILRAGIWKPRTRPNSFEGVGEVGLGWLKKASLETGIPCTTEVANEHHVEAALKAGIDILWIGARTTVNPFSVQEIANALKGVDIPVLIKNPINPDLNLWIGAFERMNNVGITKLGAIHRGFSGFEKSPFRNVPKWDIPIELRRALPNIPIICDPSHIGGTRDLISLISQKALDLDMDGLMIESHISPDDALSDAKQQITPERFKLIVDQLIIRKKDIDDPEFKSKLEKLREQIDLLDEEIMEKMAARFKLIGEIGEEKRSKGVTILQVDRWDEIIGNRKLLATKLGMSEEFVDRLLKIVHKESINHQTKIMN
jgi:chorismate mutase